MEHSPAFLRLVEQAKQEICEMSCQEFFSEHYAKLRQGDGDVLLIDVREDHEWNQMYIPCAKHMGKGILERDIEKTCPDKDKKIILYCGGGFRSALSAQALKSMGYRNVFSLAGGIKQWKLEQRPLEYF